GSWHLSPHARCSPSLHAALPIFQAFGEQLVGVLAFADQVRDANAFASQLEEHLGAERARADAHEAPRTDDVVQRVRADPVGGVRGRKSTRLNSRHVKIAYAVVCA